MFFFNFRGFQTSLHLLICFCGECQKSHLEIRSSYGSQDSFSILAAHRRFWSRISKTNPSGFFWDWFSILIRILYWCKNANYMVMVLPYPFYSGWPEKYHPRNPIPPSKINSTRGPSALGRNWFYRAVLDLSGGIFRARPHRGMVILHYHIASIFHGVNSRAVFPNSARAGGIEINTI